MRQSVDHVNHQPASADELLELLHAVVHRLRAHRPPAGDAADALTPLELRVLGFFARHPGATQRDLAEHSGRDKGQLARLLAGLRERGWLVAEVDPADRRQTRLQLSAQARRRHEAVQAQRRLRAEAALARFDPAARGQLRALLNKLLDALDPAEG